MHVHDTYMVCTMYINAHTGFNQLPQQDFVANTEMQFSNVYEVNQWLWQFGRGKQRLGGLSVEETDDRKDAAQQEQIVRGAETRRRRKADQAWWEMNCTCEQSTYNLIQVQTMYVHIIYLYILVYTMLGW